MTYQNFYTDGTVSVANGSTTVTGTGTAWDIAGVAGGLIMIRGFPGIPVVGVTGDGELEIAWPWPHSSQTEATYAIGLVSADASTALFLNTNVRRVIQQWFMAGLRPYGAGTLVERDALDPAPDTGEFWLRWEEGEQLEIYRKEDDGWSGPRLLQGETGPVGPAAVLNWIDGGWQDDTAYSVNDGLQHNGTSYRANTGHTSSAATEPGVGVDWETVWEIAAAKGDQGDKGWSFEPAVVPDGQRRVIQISDFIGGEGTKPAGTGQYVGVGGLTSDIAQAIDIRGATGGQGPRGVEFQGAWDDATEYLPNDLVIDDDGDSNPAVWISLTTNTDSRPRDNAADWSIFPGTFALPRDYGLITETATEARDYGTIA